MGWTSYPQGTVKGGVTPPLIGSDGNMWMGSGTSTHISDPPLVTIQSPSGGTPTAVNFATSENNELDQISNLATDGTYMMMGWGDNFPRNYAGSIKISGHASAAPTLGGYLPYGALVVGTVLFITGSASGNHPGLSWYAIPPSFTNQSNAYGSLSGFGYAIYDGTNIWCNVPGQTAMYKINPSTHVGTLETLTAATIDQGFDNSAITAAQVGFDGRYIYLAASAGGVIIYDTVGNTSVKVGTTAFFNCYYSHNLGLVVLDDTSGNIYTMPAGASGGSFTTIGVKNTITGATIVAKSGGYGDGPSGSLWGTGVTAAAAGYMFAYSATATVNGNFFFMLGPR